MTTSRMRHRYLAALGLSGGLLVACRGGENVSTPDATPTTEPTGTAALPLAVSTAAATASASTTASATAPAPSASVAFWLPAPPKPRGTGTGVTVRPPPDERPLPECPNGKFCVAAKDAAGSPKASAPFSACAETVSDPTPAPSESRQIRFDAVTTKVERASAADACCYSWYVPCPGGRPLLVEGEARVAAEARSAAWLEDDAVLDSAPALDASTRSALAMHYAREAAYEHASVAAFARVSLSLLAAGAPPDLVADTHRAALDEIEHARAMYGVASNLRDAPIGPGPLDLSGVASPTASIVEIAEEAFLEGCVGEAAAALVLREEARAATSIEIRAILERIADDEERHAELAWRTVQWALGADDGVRGALERAMRLLSEEQTLPPEDAHVLPGIVGTRGRLLARRAAIHEVVEPCLRALLARGQAS